MIIRQVQRCDYKEVTRLLNHCFNKHIPIDIEKFDRWTRTLNQYTFVGIVDRHIVAVYTILIEHKLIHNYGKVARGEDLAVTPEYRKRGLAKKMIEYAMEFCKLHDVYKFITTCSPEMKEPYKKIIGAYEHEINLRRDF